MNKLIKKFFLGVFMFALIFSNAGYVLAVTIGSPSLVSKSTSGVIGNNESGDTLSISSDGRYIVFSSRATNLVSGDTNNSRDIFLRDTQTSTTTRISVSSAGVESDNVSSYPSISSDGRYIVFESNATNLVANDTNNTTDIFLHDTQLSTTTRVSVSPLGIQVTGESKFPSISIDGRYVFFSSQSTDHVAGDINGRDDTFMRDLQTSTTSLVSVSTAGVQANESAVNFSISPNGRYVVFSSSSTNLVSGDTNGFSDIFVRDTQLNTTTRVSVSTAGVETNDESNTLASISSDGRYVVFQSNATNLVANDTNNASDIFLRDTQLNTTTRVSVSSMGVEGDAGSYYEKISSDGRYVIFSSDATNLVTGDTNGSSDTFIYDTQNSTTQRVSLTYLGAEANNGSYTTLISSDNSLMFFASDATNIVLGDTNNSTDIFLVSLTPPISTPTTSTTSASSITTTTAVLTGNITDTGGENNTERGFDIGTDNTYTMTDVADATGSYTTGSYSLTATGLTCGTTYHFRAYSTNTSGTGTGSDSTFATSACPTTSSSSSSGTSASARATNLINMGKVQEAVQILNEFPTQTQNVNLNNNTTTPKPTNTPTVRKGNRNSTVKYIQEYLKIKADGIFGPITQKAVIEFQKQHNLVPDGVVGPMTWGVINNI